jgi:hypothetical protein
LWRRTTVSKGPPSAAISMDPEINQKTAQKTVAAKG